MSSTGIVQSMDILPRAVSTVQLHPQSILVLGRVTANSSYPSPKNFVVYSNPPGYPTPNNQPAILGPGGLVGGPPPPPPVLIDQDFERAQRMLDVCPGLAQKIAKLRSTRNSSMLSTEISTQKASMDLHWQSGEFKTMAESQLEKSGGGVSLGMGF
ncbi:hypothetical protein MJO28_005939 [Puccinia striiformis f. sp. tritici]|uniref:Uncharacterized protein n=2 Tax=Puccinia striiformis TaxID=27350 RepID=A0A2S4VPU9_9BASI|nr:hypothetical protein Pst134EB_012153 [Puccinia striiformis f. sp. tritici]KAI7953392.1 hypothetical protein MJO28_005939 [Puccinia striiformis f. sp. tritici]KAI7957734.1 hypothetical protein MJO29_005951 [Puccinia striiformis f. sp. tritici]POW11430.1 hypothetical protein PSHT_08405 [Puccinia striiformis]